MFTYITIKPFYYLYEVLIPFKFITTGKIIESKYEFYQTFITIYLLNSYTKVKIKLQENIFTRELTNFKFPTLFSPVEDSLLHTIRTPSCCIPSILRCHTECTCIASSVFWLKDTSNRFSFSAWYLME